jgi:NitT/TauT family transport system substrate-binding protein
MTRKKVMLIASIAVVAVAIALGLILTQSRTPAFPVIKFGYRPISPSLDFFVAMDKRYFEEEGLTVEVEMFRGSSDLTDAVMAGKVDFATDLGMVTQLLPMMRTGEYKVLFLSLDLDAIDSPMRGPTLVVKKDIGVSKIEELRGKSIGVFPDVNFKVFLEAMLRKHGLNIDNDVTVIQIPPQEQMAAFASIDALFSLDPITSGIEAKYGAVALVDRVSARYIFNNFPAAASSVNADYARQHPEVVAKVERALARGIDFVREHPEKTAETLAKWTNLPVETARTMEPVRYAKHDEIDVKLLQGACDYLKEIQWLNLDRNLDASRLVWRREE